MPPRAPRDQEVNYITIAKAAMEGEGALRALLGGASRVPELPETLDAYGQNWTPMHYVMRAINIEKTDPYKVIKLLAKFGVPLNSEAGVKYYNRSESSSIIESTPLMMLDGRSQKDSLIRGALEKVMQEEVAAQASSSEATEVRSDASSQGAIGAAAEGARQQEVSSPSGLIQGSAARRITEEERVRRAAEGRRDNESPEFATGGNYGADYNGGGRM